MYHIQKSRKDGLIEEYIYLTVALVFEGGGSMGKIMMSKGCFTIISPSSLNQRISTVSCMHMFHTKLTLLFCSSVSADGLPADYTSLGNPNVGKLWPHEVGHLSSVPSLREKYPSSYSIFWSVIRWLFVLTNNS